MELYLIHYYNYPDRSSGRLVPLGAFENQLGFSKVLKGVRCPEATKKHGFVMLDPQGAVKKSPAQNKRLVVISCRRLTIWSNTTDYSEVRYSGLITLCTLTCPTLLHRSVYLQTLLCA